MSTSTTGPWRERKTGQFASRQHLTSQRKALLAPTPRWRREWTASPTNPSSPVRVLRWVRCDAATADEHAADHDEAQLLLATAARSATSAGSTASAPPLAGMSTETPPPGTPSSVTAAPAVASAARTPHPLAQEVTVASSPRAAVEVMDVDALEEAQPQHSKLSEVVQTDSHIAVAALASLPRPDGA